ncbi:competence type IV pilus assembly protein ComGB [Evansella tamaricis]|uniref:Type II secretion system F family protein n=1 Tax=Evansella tamaricis TaxID=2069301 RepID=A0ABS6JGA6_9BACI|nr:type II secretion system F family protein [Evansella tamaricis]
MGKRVFRNNLARSDWLLQLHSLFDEGYSLSESLQLLMEFEKGKRKDWCRNLYLALEAGDDLAPQLSAGGFSKEVINIIHLSERYGDLKKGLMNGSSILKKKHELSHKGKKVLSYPLFLFVGLIIMGSILSEGVFPHFLAFFESVDQELPVMTKLVIVLLSIFKLPVLLVLLGIIFLVIIWFRRKSVYEQIHFCMKIPFIRPVMKTILTYYLASQLAPLLVNGFSLHRALVILQEDSQLPFFQIEATSIMQDLINGDLLSESIEKRTYFEGQLSSIIALGEAKGSIGKELEKYANFLFRTTFDRIQHGMTVLQPMLIGLIGIVVMFLFLSMMLPIFHIVDGW